MSARLCVALVGVAVAAPAGAHHDTAVQQVGASTGRDVDRLLDDVGPRIEARVGFSWPSYGRLQQGSQRFDDAEPTVTVERYTLGIGARLASRTHLDLALPTGRVHGATDGPFGLGDLLVSASQGLGPARLGALLTAPTGRYTADSVSSVVEISPSETGDLDMITYDARASLGAGAWRSGLTAGVRGGGERFAADLSTTYIHTVGQTPDDIHWGSDATAQATVTTRALAERLTVGAGLLGQLHTADRVAGEPRDGDEPFELRTSRRRSLGLVGTIGARIASGVACGARAQVPMTQWVQGIQLAESFTVSGQCTVARGLGVTKFGKPKSKKRSGSEG